MSTDRLKGYSRDFNTDDVFIRAVLLATINFLDNKVTYVNRRESGDELIKVPFFFSLAGDERFLQDFFLDYSECSDTALDNYDKIPRGVVIPTSVNIDSSSLTNNFVRGSFVEIVDGVPKTFSAPILQIPLKIDLDLKILVDTYLNSYKIFQNFIEVFYKNHVYEATYKKIKIDCQLSFSEGITNTKSFEFAYPNDERLFLESSLELETYMPIIDETQKVSAGNTINSISANIGNLDNIKIDNSYDN